MTDLEFLAEYDPKSGKPLDVYFHGDEAVVISVRRDHCGELIIDIDVRDDERVGGAGWVPVLACVGELTFSLEA